jgi:hypothetical protein
MIATLLGWTKLPQWALELIVIAIVAGGVWYWQHERYEAGISAQVLADAKARDALIAATNAQTVALQTKATLAEQAYDKERQSNIDYQRDNPIEPVRLCIAAKGGGSHMPKTSVANPGNAATGAAAGNVLSVPSGDNSGGTGASGPDISGLLGLLAAKGDDVSGVLREFQHNE